MNLKQENGKTILSLDGEITVAKASLLRDNLLQSFRQSNEIEISFDDVTSVDLSCLQILHSARRSAREKKKKLIIQADNAPVLQQAQSWAGFDF